MKNCLKDLIECFLESVDEVKSSDLAPETPFRNLSNWNSLAAISLLTSIDEKFGIQMPATDFGKCNTIADVCNLIDRRING